MLHLGEKLARNKVNVLKKIKVTASGNSVRQYWNLAASSKIKYRSTASPKCTNLADNHI
jgi:hypothetical protein